MQYNKFHDQCSAIDVKRSMLIRKVGELEATQRWHKTFNLSAAATDLGNAKRSAAEFARKTSQLEPEASKTRSEVTRLKEQASLGWNPTYWFSAERSTFKAQLLKQTAVLVDVESRLESIKTQANLHSSAATRIESDLKKYNQHDPLAFDAEIDAKTKEILALSMRKKEIEQQRDELDAKLSAPLIELKKLELQRSSVASDRSRAQTMDDQMSNADNSYEKAMIHEKCKQAFGDSSPRKIMNAKGRELEGLDRNIKKLQMRLEAIAEKSSRTIRRLIIDGNNMCYVHSSRNFLGLSALRPVANSLAEKYEVMVVFDSSIRDQLQKSDRQIVDCFSERVRVHIVAIDEKADETLLKIASEQDDWIISGDRFGEYPEIPAVRDKRLIRHEILEDRVLINDLDVEVRYR